MRHVSWGWVVVVVILVVVALGSFQWWGLAFRSVDDTFPLTPYQRLVERLFRKDIKNRMTGFSAALDPTQTKLRSGGYLDAADKVEMLKGLAEEQNLGRERTELFRRGLGLVKEETCPVNPKACRSCTDPLAIDFGPTENERLEKTRRLCWQVVVIPETRPYYRVRNSGPTWLWFAGGEPFLDDLGVHVKAGPTTSIRFMAHDKEGEIWVKIGRSRAEIEQTPRKLVFSRR